MCEGFEILGYLRAAFVIGAIAFVVYLLQDPSLQAYMRTWFSWVAHWSVLTTYGDRPFGQADTVLVAGEILSVCFRGGRGAESGVDVLTFSPLTGDPPHPAVLARKRGIHAAGGRGQALSGT